MDTTALKFFGVALIFVVAGAGIVWGIDYYQYRKSPEYQAKLKMQELESAVKADRYGGTTPEETLALFIDALKRGDIDLASKYFVMDTQEMSLSGLKQLKDKNLLSDLIKELHMSKINNPGSTKDSFQFIFTDTDTGSKLVLPFVRNSNHKWKIASF